MVLDLLRSLLGKYVSAASVGRVSNCDSLGFMKEPAPNEPVRVCMRNSVWHVYLRNPRSRSTAIAFRGNAGSDPRPLRLSLD